MAETTGNNKPLLIEGATINRARNVELEVLREHQYTCRASNGRGTHFLQTRPNRVCTCPSDTFTPITCKHLLRALAYEGAADVVSFGLRDHLCLRVGTREPMIPEALIRIAASTHADEAALDLVKQAVTDPTARPEDFREIAKMDRFQESDAYALLLRFDVARQDPEVRRIIRENAHEAFVLLSLLWDSEGDEFRDLFRQLGIMDMGKTISVLKTAPAGISSLRFSDIHGYMHHEDAEVRRLARLLLGKIDMSDIRGGGTSHLSPAQKFPSR